MIIVFLRWIDRSKIAGLNAALAATGFLIFFCLCPVGHGQSPSLDLIEPSVVTRGQIGKVRALGASVGSCTQALLPSDGFKVVQINRVDADTVDLLVEVLPTCKLGLHPIRLVNSNGITEIQGLTVTPFETVSEEDARKDTDVSKNRTVLGTLEGDEIDRFAVELQLGQWVCAEVAAVRLGGKLLDTAISLIDPSGLKLLEIDDTPLAAQDPFFSYQVTQPGRYEVAVRAIGADADANSHYALHLGHFPRPARATPLGSIAGQRWRFDRQVSGFHADGFLPVLPKETKGAIEFIELGAQAADGSLVHCPTPLPVRISPEGYAFSTNEQDLHVAPFVFEATMAGQKDVHDVRFRVPADGAYQVAVYGSRLGSLLDATLEILEEHTGVSIASAEDVDSLDASLEFYGKADQVYLARVDDKRFLRGEDYFYRLELGARNPDLTAFIARRDKYSQAHQSIGVPKGNRVLALVGLRSDTGDPEIVLDPQYGAKGLEFSTVPFTQNKRIRPVVVSADRDAPLGWEETRLVPVSRGPFDGQESSGSTLRGEFVQVLDLIRGPADALYFGMQLDHFMVGVVEPIPVWVELLPLKAPLSVDGTLKIDGVVQRGKRADGSIFEGAIDVYLSHLPEGVTAPVQTRVAKGSNNFSIELQATSQAPQDQWPLVLEAAEALSSEREAAPQIGAIDIAVGSWATNASLVCSSIRTLDIVANPAKGHLEPIALESGETREVVCEIALDPPFDGPFEARIEGLPNRLESSPVEMQASDRRIRFRISAPEDAPLGRFDSVYVRLIGERNGQDVSYCICRSTVLVIAHKGQLVKDSSGRPLSPLDALRQKSKASR
jgi:hypothetical protein